MPLQLLKTKRINKQNKKEITGILKPINKNVNSSPGLTRSASGVEKPGHPDEK